MKSRSNAERSRVQASVSLLDERTVQRDVSNDMMVRSRPQKRICFVARNAYGALAGGTGGHIGGVERQMSLMARWFAARGYPVSMLTWDEGHRDGAPIDGVRVFNVCPQDAGLPGVRFFWPRWSSLADAMSRANADIYYQNCAEYVTGQVALWCRRHQRRFIYSIASDPDCDDRLPKMRSFREKILYRYGLKHADRIIVQSRKQQAMLRSNFRRDSIALPMPCPGPGEDELIGNTSDSHETLRVLWVGRIYEVKRPDRLLDLAERCPEIAFDMVGQPADTEYARAICERAKKLTNVHFHGPVERDRVSDFYRKADLLCCTSDFEGFPNTFLEAWSYGLPVVSTIDPDNLIQDQRLGRACRSASELAGAVQALLASETERHVISQTAREFYLQNYTVDRAMERFERLFYDAAGAISS